MFYLPFFIRFFVKSRKLQKKCLDYCLSNCLGVNMKYDYCVFFQGNPGGNGLKGESGDPGPQVKNTELTSDLTNNIFK